ncbi:MAG: glycerate kinase [Cyanobacteria bacterium J06621_3]
MSNARAADNSSRDSVLDSVPEQYPPAAIEYSSDLWPAIIHWGEGHQPSPAQLQRLRDWPIEQQIWQRLAPQATQRHAGIRAPGIKARTAEDRLTRRAMLLQTLCQRLAAGTAQLPIAGAWQEQIVLLWSFWLPLALQIDAAQKQLNTVYVQGILGGQGTGKSTLASILQLLLGLLGQRSVSLSIDDLYLTYRERRELTAQDPRFVWRGPPGTHDVALGLQTLQALTQQVDGSIAVPRFDKSQHGGQGDRTEPALVLPPTVVLFEGWFVGTQPLPDAVINADTFDFPPPIVSADDRQFARDCNHKLREYLPLWDYLHNLVVLRPEDYRLSLQWRQKAERDMIAAGKPGLSSDEIVDFVTYFWKALHPELFIAPLISGLISGQTEGSGSIRQLKAPLVANVASAHQIESLCLPGDRTDKAV